MVKKQMKYLYLHGLGQKPDSWDRVIKETKVSDSSVSLSLAEMLEGKAATYKELYTASQKSATRKMTKSFYVGSLWVLFWHLIMR